jgi:hypothetical protein
MSDGKLAGSHGLNCCVQRWCHQTKQHGGQHAKQHPKHHRWQLNATPGEAFQLAPRLAKWLAPSEAAREAQNPLSQIARRIFAGKSPDVHAVFVRRPRCQRRCRRVAVGVAGALSPNVSRALPRAVEKSSIPVRSRASHLKIGGSLHRSTVFFEPKFANSFGFPRLKLCQCRLWLWQKFLLHRFYPSHQLQHPRSC